MGRAGSASRPSRRANSRAMLADIGIGPSAGSAVRLRRELEQRERIAGRRAVEPVQRILRHARAPQELRGVGAIEPGDAQDAQVRAVEQRRLALAHGEHDRDRIGEQPARGEEQRLGAGRVEPVRVVDDHAAAATPRPTPTAGSASRRRRRSGPGPSRARAPAHRRARSPAAAGSGPAPAAPGAAARRGPRTAPRPPTGCRVRAAPACRRHAPPHARAATSCRCPARRRARARRCDPLAPGRAPGPMPGAHRRGPAACGDSATTRWGP